MESTQVRNPWRAALRTFVAAAVGLVPLLPTIANEFGWSSIPWVASVIAISTAITRILATQAATDWLEKYANWLLPEQPLPPFDDTKLRKKESQEDEEY